MGVEQYSIVVLYRAVTAGPMLAFSCTLHGPVARDQNPKVVKVVGATLPLTSWPYGFPVESTMMFAGSLGMRMGMGMENVSHRVSDRSLYPETETETETIITPTLVTSVIVVAAVRTGRSSLFRFGHSSAQYSTL